ncbi:type II toxin-antitoxin system VapC family toxin [Iningainema tapete]|uniref:Type II toxin-antitoxin system VapC family toxin n=1 Tax=Iningainema tapete BLCC-T55 TaxID=2748662 RepID=A0A8J6XJS4_9CYAN|nr:type II toxin-antitoxin system VapC family toxin [Iningainema tapete]MBD2775853.1 type II toxin-antitoxin system VapC family toxin [Iningainema tapete BLCC-T55]
MIRYILDTDHFSLWQRNHPVVTTRIQTINPDNLAITIITAEELIRGRFNVIRQASESSQVDKLVSAYMKLWNTLEDFKSLNILKFDQNAYSLYTEFRSQKIRIGTQDLRIASIVLANNSILVTRNQRDFAQVPALIFEDWTIQP